jgi:hypothetical protein
MAIVRLVERPNTSRVAVQWTGDNLTELQAFQAEYFPAQSLEDNEDGTVTIVGLWPAGLMQVGDWLCNVDGVLTPELKNATFQEVVGDGPYAYAIDTAVAE